MSLPRIAVHKFSSCDGCQLALLNLGEDLLALAQRVELVHFAEAGPLDENAHVDVAIVEGSISTPDEMKRIEHVRANSDFLVAIGACATSGGLQALRNIGEQEAAWRSAIYASPETIASLAHVTPISARVSVDLELWGCPVTGRQVVDALNNLLLGVKPRPQRDPVCMECKRAQNPCVLVTGRGACMGPVTRGGCGAICPAFGRGCYACFGPTAHPNTRALARRFDGIGLLPADVQRRFHLVHSAAPGFREAGPWTGGDDE